VVTYSPILRRKDSLVTIDNRANFWSSDCSSDFRTKTQFTKDELWSRYLSLKSTYRSGLEYSVARYSSSKIFCIRRSSSIFPGLPLELDRHVHSDSSGAQSDPFFLVHSHSRIISSYQRVVHSLCSQVDGKLLKLLQSRCLGCSRRGLDV
jgi:hypothetical protein